MDETNRFLFVVCQVGAERALKDELGREWPEFRFAFSRPGFVTFKLPTAVRLADDFDLHSVFARAYGFSLGKIDGDDPAAMAQTVWQLADGMDCRHLHVWERDRAAPGDRGFEPGVTPAASAIAAHIAAAAPASGEQDPALPVNETAFPKQRVLDCVLVGSGQWWVGYHRVAGVPSRWPGGVCPTAMPPHAVSRAYLKMVEAVQWSRLPLAAGERCVEIGSSPGGACQALLDMGLLVTGVDPAEMDPKLLEHPRFTHVRQRGADMKRREYSPYRWLAADSNVAPVHTLDTVEAIVTHPQVQIHGLLLTLKLLQWELADQIPAYLERVRSWGYRHVKARQLSFNRQEICVAAMRRRGMRRGR